VTALRLLTGRLLSRRTRDLQDLASDRGWTWSAQDARWVEAFAGEPFGRGTGRRARGVLSGRSGDRELVALDYTCTTAASGSDPGQVHRYAVLALRLPAPLQRVELVPRRLPASVGRGLELESEAFTARYRLTADDPRLASDVLPARTLQLLLDRRPLAVRLQGRWAVSWAPGRLTVAALLVRLETLDALLDGVPRWVWSDRA
jgi:hypothetical protein